MSSFFFGEAIGWLLSFFVLFANSVLRAPWRFHFHSRSLAVAFRFPLTYFILYLRYELSARSSRTFFLHTRYFQTHMREKHVLCADMKIGLSLREMRDRERNVLICAVKLPLSVLFYLFSHFLLTFWRKLRYC
jgi:hypothetical protein